MLKKDMHKVVRVHQMPLCEQAREKGKITGSQTLPSYSPDLQNRVGLGQKMGFLDPIAIYSI